MRSRFLETGAECRSVVYVCLVHWYVLGLMSENINISAGSEGLTGVCLTQKERTESQAQEAQGVSGCRAAEFPGWDVQGGRGGCGKSD